jgi:hypothetical protein
MINFLKGLLAYLTGLFGIISQERPQFKLL